MCVWNWLFHLQSIPMSEQSLGYHGNNAHCFTIGCPHTHYPLKSGIGTDFVTKNRSRTHTHAHPRSGLTTITHTLAFCRGCLSCCSHRRGSVVKCALTYIQCTRPAAQPWVTVPWCVCVCVYCDITGMEMRSHSHVRGAELLCGYAVGPRRVNLLFKTKVTHPTSS